MAIKKFFVGSHSRKNCSKEKFGGIRVHCAAQFSMLHVLKNNYECTKKCFCAAVSLLFNNLQKKVEKGT
jgi:hypothetical protein